MAAVVRRELLERFPQKDKLLAVDDPLAALQGLAAGVRRLWGKPIISVTGSAGKTTTKELIASLLSGKFKSVLKTEGSLNGFLGIPLTLLRMTPATEIAVVEIGIDEIGAIADEAEHSSHDLPTYRIVRRRASRTPEISHKLL